MKTPIFKEKKSRKKAAKLCNNPIKIYKENNLNVYTDVKFHYKNVKFVHVLNLDRIEINFLSI